MDIKKIFAFAKNEFIYGGHLLSLGAASIVFTSAVLLNIRITWDFLLVAYIIVYIAYSYNRLMEFKNDSLTNPLRTEHIGGYVRILPYVIAASFVLALLLLVEYGNFNSVIFMLFMVAGSLLYTIFFKNLTRYIIGFKSFYVSLFWASLIILLSFYYESSLGISAILMFLFVFFRWVINVSFCDLKDIKADKEKGLLTFAVVMGKNNLLRFLSYVNIVSIFLIFLGVYLGLFPKFSIFLVFLSVYAYFYFRMAKKNFSKINYISDVLADSEFALWVVFIILGKIILW